MDKQINLQVYSEIGKLKKVLLHRPGPEIENLTPDLMDRLLFDDIPYMEMARVEHDAFAQVFKDRGIEVFYLEDLVADVLENPKIKNQMIDQFIDEANVKSEYRVQQLKEYYGAFKNNKKLVEVMIAGIRAQEFEELHTNNLRDLVMNDYPFIVDPMPNLYFTRDPFSTIGRGISLNHMATETRNRETIFSQYIFKHHSYFMKQDIPFWYYRDRHHSMEGGDQLVLSDKVLAIGISQRTSPEAIDELARNIFKSEEPFEVIIAIEIPKTRAFMHLDTVFTMLDYDKFTIHPEIEGPLSVYSMVKKDGKIVITKEVKELDRILAKYLGLDKVNLIRCGGKQGIDAAREQWNDGSNTLAISPGEVIVYARNHVTNRILESQGVKIHVMPSSELSRGRGGPRCMSMPLERESITK
ncbi:MAG: arginine deiminase [delta proteobacterium ML8_F1]|nr:MAG: arginine deiminase [delta proteobacterium ML8_F1]